jgi:hypothetical protein
MSAWHFIYQQEPGSLLADELLVGPPALQEEATRNVKSPSTSDFAKTVAASPASSLGEFVPFVRHNGPSVKRPVLTYAVCHSTLFPIRLQYALGLLASSGFNSVSNLVNSCVAT